MTLLKQVLESDELKKELVKRKIVSISDEEVVEKRANYTVSGSSSNPFLSGWSFKKSSN